MRVLLDTNAYSLLMRGHEQVAEIVRAAEELLFSAVVVGELLYGFRRGSRFAQNAADLRSVLNSPYSTFVDVNSVTADRYSRIAATLRAKGRPLPTNDVWIAAQAMETGADLVSGDSHFEHVDGIVWIPLTTVG
ncbi:MAG: type II toxin-antitoxin system VapC family toxin [bacterium]|nr:type II toxin-antitoxin system VapC family toxin [bacterium]MCY4134347.1 type II toxin-antitoxin system VapC family toxin [bacterium]